MLTPEEIQAREFLVSLRGYDRDEVHSFLEEIAQHIGDLHSQLEALQGGEPRLQPPEGDQEAEPARLSNPTADPKPFLQDLGQTTQRIVEAAYESAAEIQRKARSRADRELAEARDHAEKIVAEGQRRREVIEGLVEMLEERRAALADELRGVGRMVEQMLNDFAPRAELPASDEPQITAPDEDWALGDGDAVEEADPDAASEASQPGAAEPDAPTPVAGAAELSELEELDEEDDGRAPSPHGGDRAGSPTEAVPQVSQEARLA